MKVPKDLLLRKGKKARLGNPEKAFKPGTSKDLKLADEPVTVCVSDIDNLPADTRQEIFDFEIVSHPSDSPSSPTAVPESEPGPQSQLHTDLETKTEPEPGTQRDIFNFEIVSHPSDSPSSPTTVLENEPRSQSPTVEETKSEPEPALLTQKSMELKRTDEVPCALKPGTSKEDLTLPDEPITVCVSDLDSLLADILRENLNFEIVSHPTDSPSSPTAVPENEPGPRSRSHTVEKTKSEPEPALLTQKSMELKRTDEVPCALKPGTSKEDVTLTDEPITVCVSDLDSLLADILRENLNFEIVSHPTDSPSSPTAVPENELGPRSRSHTVEKTKSEPEPDRCGCSGSRHSDYSAEQQIHEDAEDIAKVISQQFQVQKNRYAERAEELRRLDIEEMQWQVKAAEEMYKRAVAERKSAEEILRFNRVKSLMAGILEN